MNSIEILEKVWRLQAKTTIEEETAWEELKPLGVDVVPYLLEAYPKFKNWQGRCSLVYHSVKFSRISIEAFQLGIAALKDKSKIVRYRACGLLAYSLKKEALPYLKEVAQSNCAETRNNALAAIDAINSRNHHYFIDREHTGKSFWVVNEGDRTA